MTSASPSVNSRSKIVALRQASPEELEKISRDGLLSLSQEEMAAIQKYFQIIDRDPTDVELETIAQTWSEHCVHKTIKARMNYEEKNIEGTPALASKGPKVYENLLKETIVKATEELKPEWCLSVFKDNAGVIEFDADDALSFKVETHNHPSALEPYGGAGTGLGGVIRDVLGCGLGGKPIMNTDVFCFGPLDTPQDDLPDGALHPKRIAHGVIAGVRDYGNRMGIPTANGAVTFDRGYIGNPLVFCGTVGFMPKSTIAKTVLADDLVVVMGGRTGRDGIHGATFSSAPLESGISSSVVQLGHAIMEKKFMDVLLQARNKKLYRSITDCGAGGFSSAIGELGAETGVAVQIEKAPLKYPGLMPWEIWVSESQERMVLAVPPANWNALRTLCEQEDVEAVVVGKFTTDKRLRITYENELVADLDMSFLHDGIPKLSLTAVWDAPAYAAKHVEPSVSFQENVTPANLLVTLQALLKHPIIASKEAVIRQYDHEVQGGSVIKPLMGESHDGPTDACVFRPKFNSWKGFAVSNGLNQEIGKWDPYIMARTVIDEALRNMISIGGGLSRVAILDNFCWGDAKDPLEMGSLVRASEGCREAAMGFGLPFISGKDSLNNTWRTKDGVIHSIPATLLISAIGLIDDIRECISPSLKETNNLLYLIGESSDQMKGALAARLWGRFEGTLPDVKITDAKALYKKLQSAMKNKWVRACHDLSEGGLAIAAAEMAFGSAFGIELDLTPAMGDPATFLFSEAPSRFLIEVPAEKKMDIENHFGPKLATCLGKVTKTPSIKILFSQEKILLEAPVAELKSLWKNALEHI